MVINVYSGDHLAVNLVGILNFYSQSIHGCKRNTLVPYNYQKTKQNNKRKEKKRKQKQNKTKKQKQTIKIKNN